MPRPYTSELRPYTSGAARLVVNNLFANWT